MKKPPGRPSPFLWVAVTLLAGLCAAWAVNRVHLGRLERELGDITADKLAEFGAGDGSPPPNRMATQVVVAKPYVFWGQPAAKLSLYVEHLNGSGETLIEGYEFFFARNADGAWTQTESGRCASEHCTLEGKKLLDSLDEAL